MKFTNTKMSPWALCLLLLLLISPMLHAAANEPTPPPPCPLAPPTSVTVTDVSTNSLTAAWTAVPGALMYKVTVKNLNTNLIIATVYTSNTTKFINGLPSDTPLRVGVSASRCNTQNPANFGSEKTTDTRTLKYIVAEIIVNRCALPRTHNAPWSVIGEAIPLNSTSNLSWDYYQAKVTGTKNNNPWSCRFSIVAACADNLTGAGFYIFVDTEETQNVSYTTDLPLGVAEFKCQDALLFTVQSATLFSANQAGTTDIIFPAPSGGVVISTFESTAGPSCNQPSPSGFTCIGGGGDANIKSGNIDRDASTDTAAASDYAASLAPNPTTDRVDLRFHLSAASEVAVSLYDPAGRKVQHLAPQSVLPEGQNQIAVDVSALPPGFYFVQLRSAQGQETLTLVKQ